MLFIIWRNGDPVWNVESQFLVFQQYDSLASKLILSRMKTEDRESSWQASFPRHSLFGHLCLPQDQNFLAYPCHTRRLSPHVDCSLSLACHLKWLCVCDFPSLSPSLETSRNSLLRTAHLILHSPAINEAGSYLRTLLLCPLKCQLCLSQPHGGTIVPLLLPHGCLQTILTRPF